MQTPDPTTAVAAPAVAARSTRAAYLSGGLRAYGMAFVVEVLLFYVTLIAYQQLGYGQRSQPVPPFTGPVLFYLALGVFMVAMSMAAAEARFRLYRRVWAVAGLTDAIAVVLAVAEATALITLCNALIPDLPPYGYRPFRLLVPLLAAPSVVAAISFWRLLPRLRGGTRLTRNPLLVVVYGERWYATIRALAQNPNPEWQPVGILTTDPRRVNQTVLGIPVIGLAADLQAFIGTTGAQGVAFIANDAPVSELAPFFAACLDAEMPIFMVPDALRLLDRQSSSPLRPLTSDDLVGRMPRDIGLGEIGELVSGRTVMVTGGAGSIGSELARLVSRLKPARLVLVDNNESGLFDTAIEIRAATGVPVVEKLVSVSDYDFLLRTFEEERPELVFHAAAYKHVPMLEVHPEQAVLVNILGTRNVLSCAEATGVERMVAISTDKAVASHSLMGCSKRIAELIVMSGHGRTQCWCVRFGNVIGSRGSVLPTFERQIEQGGPITITHPDMTRYMMTIREAASLVVSTLAFGRAGLVYMLDMGDPISIVKLAHSLVRSRGLRPDVDIKIEFTGLRPGERLTEELLLPGEQSRPTLNPAVQEIIPSARPNDDDLLRSVDRLVALARQGQTEALVDLLRAVATGSPRGTQEVPESIRRTAG